MQAQAAEYSGYAGPSRCFLERFCGAGGNRVSPFFLCVGLYAACGRVVRVLVGSRSRATGVARLAKMNTGPPVITKVRLQNPKRRVWAVRRRSRGSATLPDVHANHAGARQLLLLRSSAKCRIAEYTRRSFFCDKGASSCAPWTQSSERPNRSVRLVAGPDCLRRVGPRDPDSFTQKSRVPVCQLVVRSCVRANEEAARKRSRVISRSLV
jgi:hypothetical protein